MSRANGERQGSLLFHRRLIRTSPAAEAAVGDGRMVKKRRRDYDTDTITIIHNVHLIVVTYISAVFIVAP